jgi:DNA-binding LacI/PurR family transcriptional regulator
MASLAKRGLMAANSARVSDRGRKRVIMVKKSVNYSEPIIFAPKTVKKKNRLFIVIPFVVVSTGQAKRE